MHIRLRLSDTEMILEWLSENNVLAYSINVYDNHLYIDKRRQDEIKDEMIQKYYKEVLDVKDRNFLILERLMYLNAVNQFVK